MDTSPGDIGESPGVGHLNASRPGLRLALSGAIIALLVAAGLTDTARADTPIGTVTGYPAVANPTSLAVGSDGNIWVAQTDHVSVVSTSGDVLATHAVPAGVDSLSPGPDGRVWFDEGDTKIGAITKDGVVTSYDV